MTELEKPNWNRFQNAINCLLELKRQRPESAELQSELELAIQMIRGQRPNIEEKYDALILKLDRTYSRLADEKAYFEKLKNETVLHGQRAHLKSRIKGINCLLKDLEWMRARNADLIKAAQPTPKPQELFK